jgi:hypothetical protein
VTGMENYDDDDYYYYYYYYYYYLNYTRLTLILVIVNMDILLFHSKNLN